MTTPGHQPTEHTRELVANAMTVSQLRITLATLPDDAVVVMTRDAEGNDGASPLASLELCWYRPECTWAGELHDNHDDEDEEHIARYVPSASEVRAVALWPTN